MALPFQKDKWPFSVRLILALQRKPAVLSCNPMKQAGCEAFLKTMKRKEEESGRGGRVLFVHNDPPAFL
ncbi:MAG: hypothetical protein HZB23_01760 [Deltaproteobacteria bacterium]|nr:hypothetical protein [Deltaproteobacteria bacterium]